MKNFIILTVALFSLNGTFAQDAENKSATEELVLFTLLDKDLRYEIRLYDQKHIKTYEIKNGDVTYLGKFLNLGEVERSEPYKSLMAKARQSSRILVTDGYLGNEFYEIYIHNLFNTKGTDPVFVEVLKVNDNRSEIVSKYEREADFNQSRFAPLLQRD